MKKYLIGLLFLISATVYGSSYFGGGGGGGGSIPGPVVGGLDCSVLFVHPNDVLAQDNTNFCWDFTNTRLGIGTNTPGARFSVVQNATPANADGDITMHREDFNVAQTENITSANYYNTVHSMSLTGPFDLSSNYGLYNNFEVLNTGSSSDDFAIYNNLNVGNGTTVSSSARSMGINTNMAIRPLHSSAQIIGSQQAIDLQATAISNDIANYNSTLNIAGQLNNNASGFIWNPVVQASGNITGNIYGYYSNPQIDGPTAGYVGIQIYGNGATAPALFQGINLQPNYSGNITNMNMMNLGGGGGGLSATDYTGIGMNPPAIGNNSILLNLTPSEAVGGNETIINASNASNVTGSYNGISSFNNGTVGSGANMVNANNQGAITNTLYLFNGANTGTVTQNLNLLWASNNAAVTQEFYGVGLDNQGNIGSNLNAFRFNNQGSVGSSFTGLDLTNTGSVGGNLLGVNVNQQGNVVNGSTLLSAAMSGNVTAGDSVGLRINLTGSASSNIKGADINVDSATSPNQKSALSISGGSFSANSPYDTSVLTPAGPFFNNTLGGSLTVASGFPIAPGSYGILNNLGVGTIFQDDVGVDPLGGLIGISINGLVNQMQVASGKTVADVNYMTAGGGTQPGGGTITSANMFNAVGFVGSPGDILVPNVTGFAARSSLCTMSTGNCWSFRGDAGKLLNAEEIRSNTSFVMEDPGGNTTTITLKAPSPLLADYTLTLPTTDGGANEFLQTDGSGVLTWASGTGGTSIGAAVTGGTTGSALFVGPGPVLAQDNANYFWDDTNNRLGIGTAAPKNSLHIGSGTINSTMLSQYQAVGLGERGLLLQSDATSSNAPFISMLGSAGQALVGFSHNGTSAVPTAIANGDTMFQFAFAGWDGTDFQIPASINALVTGAVSAGTVPADLVFSTGTSSATEAFRIKSSGVLNVAGFSSAGIVHNAASGNLTSSLIVNADITNSTIDVTTKLTGVLPIANGGTNSTATPTNGGVGYGTGTAHAYSLAGSSGQILRSAGAASPTWSTATYPSTSGVAGNVIASNGTNYVSTIPSPVTGSRQTGNSMSAGTSVTATAAAVGVELFFLVGNGGAVTITASPPIAVTGLTTGQKLRLCGTSDTNTVQYDPGVNLVLNGSAILAKDKCVDLMYADTDGTNAAWIETGRN